jgi:hypothetical protein
LLRSAVSVSVGLDVTPNSAFRPAICIAAVLIWMMSAGGAFSRLETTAGDDNTGDWVEAIVWSRFVMAGLGEETDPINCTSVGISAGWAGNFRPRVLGSKMNTSGSAYDIIAPDLEVWA